MEISGRIVIVTGAGGGGSGRAIAQHFARHGARVVVSDILESGARDTVRRITSEGGQAVAFKTDVRVEEGRCAHSLPSVRLLSVVSMSS